jgi:hypothetical protein
VERPSQYRKLERAYTHSQMLEILRLPLVLGLVAALTGCGDVLSTEPLAAPGDTRFDTSLLGTWSDQDDMILTVTSRAQPVYDILYLDTNTGEKVALQGRLMRFGEHQVLDVTEAEPGIFSVPAHVWVYVTKKKPGLQIQYLDSKWFQQKVRASGLAYFAQDKHPVLTAPTAQLQELVRQHGLQAEARGPVLDLVPFKRLE